MTKASHKGGLSLLKLNLPVSGYLSEGLIMGPRRDQLLALQPRSTRSSRIPARMVWPVSMVAVSSTAVMSMVETQWRPVRPWVVRVMIVSHELPAELRGFLSAHIHHTLSAHPDESRRVNVFRCGAFAGRVTSK